MKKQVFSVILGALLLNALVSCGGEAKETADTTPTGTTADTAVVTEAVTTEAVTEAVTEAPKRDRSEYIDLSSGEGTRNPVSLLSPKGAAFATRLTFAEGFLSEATVACPSWSDNIGSLTMKVFAWDTDYETTIAGEVLASETFVDYDDNSDLTLDLTTEDSKGLAAGEYLLWLGDAVDEAGTGAGLWTYGYPEDNENIVEVYKNGKVVTGMGMDGSITITIPAE